MRLLAWNKKGFSPIWVIDINVCFLAIWLSDLLLPQDGAGAQAQLAAVLPRRLLPDFIHGVDSIFEYQLLVNLVR